MLRWHAPPHYGRSRSPNSPAASGSISAPGQTAQNAARSGFGGLLEATALPARNRTKTRFTRFPARHPLAKRCLIRMTDNSPFRVPHDFYPTPPEGTRALLAAERFRGSIWKPACADGAVSKVLAAHGYQVVSTDLIDRGFGTPGINFLAETRARAVKYRDQPALRPRPRRSVHPPRPCSHRTHRRQRRHAA